MNPPPNPDSKEPSSASHGTSVSHGSSKGDDQATSDSSSDLGSSSSGESSNTSSDESESETGAVTQSSVGVIGPIVCNAQLPNQVTSQPLAPLEPILESGEVNLDLSTESFKSADVTLRKLESDLIADGAIHGEIIESPGRVEPAAEEVIAPTVANLPVEPQNENVNLNHDSASAQLGLVRVEVNPGIQSVVDPSKALIMPEKVSTHGQLKVSTPSIVQPADATRTSSSGGANPIGTEQVAKPVDTAKDKKARKKERKRARNDRKKSAEIPAPVDEGIRIARLVASILAASNSPDCTPMERSAKKKSRKRNKSVKRKKQRRSGTPSDSESGTSRSSSDNQPASSSRIARLSESRKSQLQAMARAKDGGLSKQDSTCLVELNEALRLVESTEFLITPTMAFPDFDSIPGTKLPHIQILSKEFSAKYSPLAKATVVLQLTLARDKLRAKKALIESETSDQFAPIKQFKLDLQRTEPSSTPPMETAVSSVSGQRSGLSAANAVTIDFNQIDNGPSTSSKEFGTKRKHKSNGPSPHKTSETSRVSQDQKDRAGNASKKGHRTHKSE